MLYGKRFFPFYTYVILGGIDRDGTGAVYSFDPVGSYERESCRAAGAAQSLIQPFLDQQVMARNVEVGPGETPAIVDGFSSLSLEKTIGIVTDAFTSATERHIETGDSLEMYVVQRGEDGRTSMQVIQRELKKD